MSRPVSVATVLCTYNGERFIGEQLHSIAAQTRPIDRLVVLDDCSTDRTVEVVRDFAATAPFVVEVRINERNLGYTGNFERALGVPDEDVIVLSDQDDVWRRDKVAKLAALFEADAELGFAFSDAQLVDAELRPLAHTLWEAIGFDAQEQATARQPGGLWALLLPHNRVTGATMAIRRRYRDRFLPIPGYCVHDAWIALVLAATSRVDFVAEPLILYRQHGGNQLGARRLGVADRWRRARAQQFAELRRHRAQLLELRQRLVALGADADRIGRLDATIAHLDSRLALPARRVQRLPRVATLLARGDYREYANGVVSALRDVIA